MTRHIKHIRLLPRLIGQSFPSHIATRFLILGFLTSSSLAFAETGDVIDTTTSVSETTITAITTTEVTDRESRLRNIEDELLKQLSVGGKPTAQEGTKPSLADIKHVSEDLSAPKPSARQPQKAATPLATNVTHSFDESDDVPATVPVVSYEEIPPSSSRSPQAASVVPVSAKSAPHRRASPKKRSATESLSAKDLEHRLAIAETQLNLLTQELEETKSKLRESEASVRELTDKLRDGERASSTSPEINTNEEVVAKAVRVPQRSDSPNIDGEVARVTKNKAPLRIGPGPRESIISHLSRDNVVTIEHRTSGWYRIVTSDGARGWISGSYLVFDTDMYSDSTVHVRAYEPQLEPTAGRY